MMRRIRYQQVYNLRDLGGYPTSDGVTKSKVFYRSDNLTLLKEDEIEDLKNHGLKQVIDLRHEKEIDIEPDPFEKDEEVLYLNHTHLDTKDMTNEELNAFLLSDLYYKMATNKAFIQPIFEAFANYDGLTLFHCAAGKDRTGVITALLLKAVGVDDLDIVADYQVSKTYLLPKYSDLENNPFHAYAQLYDSKPETMLEFLEKINLSYPDLSQYFGEMGISSSHIEKIKTKFIERNTK